MAKKFERKLTDADKLFLDYNNGVSSKDIVMACVIFADVFRKEMYNLVSLSVQLYFKELEKYEVSHLFGQTLGLSIISVSFNKDGDKNEN